MVDLLANGGRPKIETRESLEIAEAVEMYPGHSGNGIIVAQSEVLGSFVMVVKDTRLKMNIARDALEPQFEA